MKETAKISSGGHSRDLQKCVVIQAVTLKKEGGKKPKGEVQVHLKIKIK